LGSLATGPARKSNPIASGAHQKKALAKEKTYPLAKGGDKFCLEARLSICMH